ncbi:MAG: 6-bladed beta-propeller [Bacteroidales bacterium]|jgi:hypothetical protein|nr:6-bladed beta-propeller [Bacteroidales bacterium]
MKRITVYVMILVFAVFAGCKDKNPAAVKNGELTVCYKSLLKDTVDIPLSLLTEELQIVKLDDADAALVSDRQNITVSENYIVAGNEGNTPAKLFERQTGKYITDLGSVGQGPGEYSQHIYHIQIDEKNGRIYLLPMMPSQILSYDLQGNFKDEKLYIPVRVPKSIFHVNGKDSIITFAVLPFTGIKTLVWSQKNMQIIQRYPTGHLSVNVDFSNEVISGFNNENVFDFQIFKFFEPGNDSLYHYDIEKNILTPVFTLDFSGSEISTHAYMELPQHYTGNFAVMLQTTVTGENSTATTPVDKFYIVDKKTLKASYFRLKNDFLGGIEVDNPIWRFKNGYFSQNCDPSVLLEQLENTLVSNKKLSEKMRAKLTELKNSISEDKDNNYILYAKLKK